MASHQGFHLPITASMGLVMCLGLHLSIISVLRFSVPYPVLVTDVYLSVLKCMHSIVCNYYFIVFIYNYMLIFYLLFPVIGGSSAVGIRQ